LPELRLVETFHVIPLRDYFICGGDNSFPAGGVLQIHLQHFVHKHREDNDKKELAKAVKNAGP
jgi:hypothetical protein